jgi:hypothetical protein
MAMAAGAPDNWRGLDGRGPAYSATPATAFADGRFPCGLDRADQVVRAKRLSQADDIGELRGFRQKVECRYPGDRDDGQIRHAFAHRHDEVGAIGTLREDVDDREIEAPSSNDFSAAAVVAASMISNWLMRSTSEIIVRTSDWSSTTRTRGMKNSRIGRATAYDENPGRRRNATHVIQPCGKGAVTPTQPFRP